MALRLKIFGAAAPSPWRRAALALLVLAVLAAHGCVTQTVAGRIDEISAVAAMPARIEVAYVRELALAAPPVGAMAAPTAPVAVARAEPVAKPASAPDKPKRAKPPKPAEPVPQAVAQAAIEAPPEPLLAAASAPEAASAPDAAASAAPPLLAAASAASPSASSVAAAAAPDPSASGASTFDWPSSTRLTYALTGNYRGEVQGEAQVEWVRVGTRYQVHLDLVVGPSFAPVVTRRMTSDGDITASGLTPQRYDQDTKTPFRDRKRLTVHFSPETVTLANGDRRPSVPGLQDTASQFVQLTYLFTTQPALLTVGGTIEVPLALPHKIDRWLYDVIDEPVLQTPFGPVPTVHLKPRRATPKIGELSAEIWFAPQLRYLPLRIRIEQDPATFIDLMVTRRPQLAAP